MASESAAQRSGRTSACTAPTTVLIAFPKAPDKAFAAQTRDRLMSTFKDFASFVCLVPKENVEHLLQQSNIAADSVFSPADLVNLGQPLRADEIIEFEAVPVGRSVQLNGRVILVRDRQGLLRDSIPKHIADPTPSVVYKEFMASYKKIREMLDHEEKCFRAGQAGNLAEAEAHARKALSVIPTSNIARICLATVLHEGKKHAEAIKVSDEVLASDPKNEIALKLQLNTYLAQEDKKKYAEIGGRLIANNPSSPEAEAIIAQLATWRETDVVLQLLDKALREDPENLTLRLIEMRVVLASDNLKLAQERGEALAKIDTSVVDTAFVNRMVNAYARDSNPQKAAEWLARGTQKWPDNIPFAMGLAQTLRNLGQTDQAVAEYKRIIAMSRQAARGVRLYIADMYNTAGQLDSAFVWLHRAADAGDDKAQIAGLSFGYGARKLQAAQSSQSKNPDDWKATIPYLAYADSLNSTEPRYSLYWGLAAYNLATITLQQMQPPDGKPTCALAKEAEMWLLLANDKVRAGGRADPNMAGQFMTNIPQLLGPTQQAIEQLKCPPG